MKEAWKLAPIYIFSPPALPAVPSAESFLLLRRGFANIPFVYTSGSNASGAEKIEKRLLLKTYLPVSRVRCCAKMAAWLG